MNQVSGRGLLLACGAYIGFELVEGVLSVGDVIDGDLDSHGPCFWTNLTTGEEVRVYVHEFMVTVEATRRFYEPPPQDQPA